MSMNKRIDIWEGSAFDSKPKLSIKKLNRYFQVNLKQRYRENNEDKYIKTKFRLCTRKDFESNGFIIPNEDIDEYENRLCPETSINDLLNLRNGY